MRQTVGLTGDKNEGNSIENTEPGPRDQNRKGIGARGHRINDTAEQDRLRDGNQGQHDVADDDDRNSQPLFGEITERSEIDFGKRHLASALSLYFLNR